MERGAGRRYRGVERAGGIFVGEKRAIASAQTAQPVWAKHLEQLRMVECARVLVAASGARESRNHHGGADFKEASPVGRHGLLSGVMRATRLQRRPSTQPVRGADRRHRPSMK